MKRHYLSLWALLAVAFTVFAVSSAFEMPYFGDRQLKSSGISDVLFPTPETTADADPADGRFSGVMLDTINAADSTRYPDIDVFPAPTDTAAQTILFIGDSMLEGLGPRLAAYASHNGHTLYTVIWYSSTSEVWGKSDKLQKYISSLKPTYIVVSLGGNELFVTDIEKKREKYVKKIIADIGDIPYLWIGPPNWRKDTGINSLIAKNTPKGTFFLSDGMSFERAKDGAHPTRSSAAQWLDSVVRWMPQNALYPIRLDKPAAETGRPKRIYMHAPDEK